MWNTIGALMHVAGFSIWVFAGFMIMVWSDLDEQRWAEEKKRNEPEG